MLHLSVCLSVPVSLKSTYLHLYILPTSHLGCGQVEVRGVLRQKKKKKVMMMMVKCYCEAGNYRKTEIVASE